MPIWPKLILSSYILMSDPFIFIHFSLELSMVFPGRASGKEPICQCRQYRRHGFDPWIWEDPLEEGMATPLQCSCLENPMDKEAQRLQSMRSQSQKRLKQKSTEHRSQHTVKYGKKKTIGNTIYIGSQLSFHPNLVTFFKITSVP